MDINSIEITREMMESVALAQLYREDAIFVLQRSVPAVKKEADAEALLRRILTDDRYEQVKKDVLAVEKVTTNAETIDTIELMYNSLLKEAKFEKKYEVVIRILKELQQLKAIKNDEMDFRINITVKKPDGTTDTHI